MAETRVKRQRSSSQPTADVPCVLPDRSVDKRLAALEFEIEQINDRLTEIDEHIDELRVDLENNADDVCDKIREDLNGISEEVRNLKRRFDSSE